MRRVLIAIAITSLAMGALPITTASAGGGPHCDGLTDDATNTVGLAMNCFVPTITRIDRGAEVRFVNKDPATHTVTGTHLTWGDTMSLQQGDEVSYTFDDDGIYPYTCIVHPGMVGAIVVGDGKGDGFARVTGGSVTWNAQSKEASSGGRAQVIDPDETASRSSSDTWAFVVAGIAALAVLAFVSTRIRKRVAAGVALTTKP